MKDMSSKNRPRFLVFVLIALVFAASQDRNLIRRLFRGPSNGPVIRWSSSLTDAEATARRENKPVFVDFAATWCGPCQNMLQETYRDADVVRRLNSRFVPVLIDIDKQPAIAARFGVGAIPDGAFLAPDGRELIRSIGYHDADEFLDLTDRALKAQAALPPRRAGSPLSSAAGARPLGPMPTFPPNFP